MRVRPSEMRPAMANEGSRSIGPSCGVARIRPGTLWRLRTTRGTARRSVWHTWTLSAPACPSWCGMPGAGYRWAGSADGSSGPPSPGAKSGKAARLAEARRRRRVATDAEVRRVEACVSYGQRRFHLATREEGADDDAESGAPPSGGAPAAGSRRHRAAQLRVLVKMRVGRTQTNIGPIMHILDITGQDVRRAVEVQKRLQAWLDGTLLVSDAAGAAAADGCGNRQRPGVRGVAG